MDTIIFAQVIGLFFVITGLSMLLRRSMMIKVFEGLFKNRTLTYMFGVLLLAVGLFIVLQHNIWTGLLEIVITVLGWYLIFEAIAYLFLPQKIFNMMLDVVESKKIYYFLAASYAVIGAYLVYAGFFVT